MRGRGERVDDLPAGAAARLRGRRVLIFKPAFGISTVWAYRRMAAEAPASYLPPAQAEARLAAWLDDPARINYWLIAFVLFLLGGATWFVRRWLLSAAESSPRHGVRDARTV